MAMDDQANEVVPVPKLLFRYAYNRESNQGVVIITVNNPFVRKLTSDLALCKEQNLCHQMYSRMKIFPMGYTYCCSLKDFADTAKRRGLPVFKTAKPF
ncbi:uncharacterized protein LOC111643492 [Copidosoma floridanum]|uniref:uncharacterized protein LOC111643492 n=1 Tax=Copidosoma floridanum TaxID=29053 RepID=UPI000C6F9ED1|nr:uncharacterized protein LOC111643492 [Copidosoma floridanum]